MAFNIPPAINLPGTGPSIGESIGTGLAGLLHGLAVGRLQKAQRQQEIENKSQALQQAGFSPIEASNYASLPDQSYRLVLQEKIKEPSRKAFGQALSQFAGQPQAPSATGIQTLEEVGPNVTGLQNLANLTPTVPQTEQPIDFNQLTENQAARIATLQESRKNTLARQDIAAKNREQKDKHLNLSETRQYRDNVTKLFKEDHRDENQRKIARQLNEKGKLSDPVYTSLLRTVGLDWDALKTADSQILGSMIEPALRKLKPTFGANTSNLELINALKTHWSDPTKSKESRDFLLDLADVDSVRIKAEYRELRDVMKNTKNNPPIDVEQVVQDRIRPEVDAAYQRFEDKWLARFNKETATQKSQPTFTIGQTLEDSSLAQLPIGTRYTKEDGSKWEKTATGEKRI